MGFSAPLYANKGEASSHGFEVQVDANHAFNKNFWLGVRGNFTYATGKYEHVEEPYRPYPWLSHIGKRINQTYGLIAEDCSLMKKILQIHLFRHMVNICPVT